MELVEEQIVRRWAPAIIAPRDAYEKYLSQASLYNMIYNRIIELAQETDVWFKVDYSNAVANKSYPFYFDVHYDFHEVTAYSQDGTKHNIARSGSIPHLAREAASWIVSQVYRG